MADKLIARASTTIRTTLDRAWEALVSPAQIKKYMFGTTVSSDWQEGSPITWKGEWQGKAYEDKGTILEVKPRRLLRYTHFSPMMGKPDRPENYHQISIALAEEQGQVRVSLDQDNNADEQARRHSEENWKQMLAALKTLLEGPVMKTGMLIRKPPAKVFEAFVDPTITTQFWFTKSSGRLETGQQVQWEWEMYGVSVPVTVKALEPNARIMIEWPGPAGSRTVEWRFLPYEGDTTFVAITESGFVGEGDDLVRQVADSTQGFTLVLAGLKAFLEHGVHLNLVVDRYPKGIESH